MKMIDRIFINQVLQNIEPLQKATVWFEGQNSIEQLNILQFLHYMSSQAGVVHSDISEAIQKSRLKMTYTPCVLLKKNDYRVQMSKVLKLPKTEYLKIFHLLIWIARITDERRRKTLCKQKCSHWWHQDLSDDRVIKKLLKGSE